MIFYVDGLPLPGFAVALFLKPTRAKIDMKQT